MTLSALILRDSQEGQSTATALADRMKKPVEAIQLQLTRMEKDGEVHQRQICEGSLTVWHVRTHKQSRPIPPLTARFKNKQTAG